MDALLTNEILRMTKLGWILEKLGNNFRQYFNIKNPKQHKTIVDALDPTDEWQVGESSDDCYVYGTGNTFSLVATNFRAGKYSAAYPNARSGARFAGVTVPQGATIISAYLKLCARQDNSGTTVLTNIQGEDVDDAATFTDYADYAARARTSALVAWDNIEGWTTDTWYTSLDIKTIIQEIKDREGCSSGNAIVIFWEDDGSSTGAYRTAYSYDGDAAKAPKLEITWTEGGGEIYEINVDAVVKASATKALQTTFNVRKDAAVTSQAVEGSETTFNISKDAVAKALTALSFELGIPVEAVVKASAVPNLESTFNVSKEAIIEALATKILQTTYNLRKDAVVAGSAAHGEETTFNISKDALVQALASVIVEKVAGQLIEIFKDAVVEAQATFSLESSFNINKDAIVKASAMVSPETIFNVVKDAIIKASAAPQVVRVIPINVDAVVKASATPSLQQTLGISKDAVVVTVSTPLIQSAFNISPEAIVKVLAEVDVTKEKPEVIRLFLVLGLQHSALVLGLSHATIDLSLETPYTIELEVN